MEIFYKDLIHIANMFQPYPQVSPLLSKLENNIAIIRDTVIRESYKVEDLNGNPIDRALVQNSFDMSKCIEYSASSDVERVRKMLERSYSDSSICVSGEKSIFVRLTDKYSYLYLCVADELPKGINCITVIAVSEGYFLKLAKDTKPPETKIVSYKGNRYAVGVRNMPGSGIITYVTTAD